VHEGSATARRDWGAALEESYRSLLRYHAKHHSDRAAAVVGAMLLLEIPARWLYWAARGGAGDKDAVTRRRAYARVLRAALAGRLAP
jgi:hypothetical protein